MQEVILKHSGTFRNQLMYLHSNVSNLLSTLQITIILHKFVIIHYPSFETLKTKKSVMVKLISEEEWIEKNIYENKVSVVAKDQRWEQNHKKHCRRCQKHLIDLDC